MRKLLTHLVNIIFPPRPTERIVQKSPHDKLANLYELGTFQSCIYLSRYQEQIIQAAIIENKFYRNTEAKLLLGQILNQWTQHQIIPTLYIPIPLGPKRLKERGYNQVSIILNSIDSDLEIADKILYRKIETTPQTKLDKKDRVNNMHGVFACNQEKFDLNKYKQIVIVDDVVTTGTTLNAARATLKKHLPSDIKILCLAIAH